MGHGHRVTNQEQQLPGRVSRISSIGEIGRRLKVRAQRKSSETNDRRTVETKPRWRKRCGNQRHPEPTRPEDIQSCFGRAFPYLIIQCNTAMYNYRASVAMLEELFIINPVDKNCVGHDKDTERIGEVVAILRGRPVGDDVIGFTDFLAASLPRVFSHWKEGHCRKAFRIFDRNGDGYIDAKELELVLRREGEETHIEAFSSMLHEAADSKQVSYKDFVKFVKQGASLEL
ncbi:Calmodulin (CaM) [Durusdinium trenchii]|uniref:Calmodulin (CaM) n=1 Tax=Durusdinium trenchii TaxID=1381693 RepID=A0ABP0HKB8_9DINO